MATRNITLTFGVASIPCKSEKATITKVAASNMCVGQPGHDAHEASPVKMPRTCETCGPIVDNSALVKGIKEGNTYKIVTQEAVAEEKVKYAQQYKGTLNLVPHPAESFYDQTAPGASVNYLIPASDAATSHYVLLAKLIESHPELAFASLYTPVSATGLYVVKVRDDVLVMEERVRTQALKPAPQVEGELNEQLFAMMDQFLEGLVTDYDPDTYEDKYQMALAEMAAKSEQSVDAKSGESVVTTSVQSDDDLMTKLAALKAVS